MPPSSNTTHQHTIIQNQLHQQGYQLVSLLGKGGSGNVWLAKDARLNRQVAVKLLHTDSATQNQMVQEARLLAKFNHPGVVQIYDILTLQYQENPEQFAIVMEFIDGSSLLAWQQETQPDTHGKLSVLLQLAQTLSYIHQQDIVHGDIKPANILLRGTQPVITDFGEAFAKIRTEKQQAETQEHSDQRNNGQQVIRSTQSWSAPEVQTQRSISPASDAYSFALVAVWLLSHWHPCEAQPGFNLHLQQHQQFLQQFDSVSQSLPQGMGLLLRKLLHWQPESRLSDFSRISLEVQQIVRLLQQQTPLNQETVLLDDPAALNSVSSETVPAPLPGNRKKTFWLAGFALLALLATGAGFLLLNTPPQTRFIALLPPDVTGSLDANREQLLASAVSHAIENNIINNKNFLLIPSADIRGVIRQAKEQEDGPLNFTQIVGNAMGATDVISIAMDCAITHCDVSLSRSEKPGNSDASSTATWTTSLSDRFSTPLVDNLRFSDAISQRFPRLLQLEGDGYSEADNISEEAYSRYLEILTEFRENEGGGDLDGLLQELEGLIETYPDFYSWYWLYRNISHEAYNYSGNTDYLNSIKRVLLESPNEYKNSLEFLIDYFWINLNSRDFNEAEQNLKAMQGFRIPEEKLKYYQAIVFFKKQNFAESLEILKQLSEYNKSSNVLHNLALSYWYLGDPNTTVQVLDQAISLNPYRMQLRQLLGSTLLILGKLDEASDVFLDLFRHTKNSIDLSNMSVIKILKGDYSQALFYANEAVIRSPNNPTWLLNKADILKLQGQRLSANTLYENVLKLNGETKELYSKLEYAQAAAHLGLVNEAIAKIEEAKKNYPDNGYVFFAAAVVYVVIDRPNVALFHINESLKLNFDTIWFALPWFSSVCDIPNVEDEIDADKLNVICNITSLQRLNRQ